VDGPQPDLPPGRALTLLDRGQTWVYDSEAEPDSRSGRDRATVALLHGWTSTAALNWCRCFTPLAEEFRVVAPDLRGHGRGIRSRRPFRLEDCADDVAAVIEHLGIGPLTVVGYSMGGPVALLLWRRHPHLVNGLVLCATAARFAARPELSGALGIMGYNLAQALSGVPEPLLRPGWGWIIRSRAADEQLASWVVREWERHDPTALVQAGFELTRFDSTAWTGGIDVPTSVVVTTLDDTVNPERQWDLAQSIPAATAFPVAASHRACVEQAQLFVPTLISACRAAAPPADTRVRA
jgi:3-oxoadipate enol-lactonase